LRFNQHRLMG